MSALVGACLGKEGCMHVCTFGWSHASDIGGSNAFMYMLVFWPQEHCRWVVLD